MDILSYQRKLFRHYKESIGFPIDRSFFFGNPIATVVPLVTEKKGCMVIGSCPKGLCYEVESGKNIPLESVRQPFGYEPYFDGRVTQFPDGSLELDEVLKKFGFKRNQCWITTLVKVFLFSSKDVAKYNELGNFKVAPDAYHFSDYAEKSMQWLAEEADIAKPTIILLFGLETVGAFFNTSPTKAKHLIDGQKRQLTLGKHKYPVLCLHEPQLLVTNNKRNPWPDVFEQRVLPEALRWLNKETQAV